MVGLIFTRWEVIQKSIKHGHWDCKCVCGTEKSLLKHDLVKGVTKSCGCLKNELFGNLVRKHGLCGTPTYNTWKAMIQRCTNPKTIGAKYYIQKGITVCDRWKKFENFLEDMGIRPEGKTLDRKDGKLGYSKDNCKWATPKEQSSHLEGVGRNNPKYDYALQKMKDGCSKKLLAEEINVDRGTLYNWLHLSEES